MSNRTSHAGASRTRAGLAALLLLALLAACSGGEDAQTAVADEGEGESDGEGFFRLGVLTPFDNLNPFSDTDHNLTRWIIYPTLATIGDSEYIPYLAESWEVSDDGLEWTYTLPEDAVWSDGTPLTAADVTFSYDLIRKFGDGGGTTGWSGGQFGQIAEWEAIDDHTLVLRYDEFVPNALSGVDDRPIVPRHIWQPVFDGDGSDVTTFAADLPVVGAGPFTVTEFRADESIIMERNEDYWGDVPRLERFGVRALSNVDAAISALRNAEIDGIEQLQPTPAIAELESDERLVVETAPAPAAYYMGMNLNSDKRSAPELLDVEVRRAIRHAVDREQIADTAFAGYAAPWGEYVFNDPFTNPDIPADEYDPERAEAILDGLGYERGADGVRVADGERMSYELLRPAEAGAYQRVAEILVTNLAAIGIEAVDSPVDEDIFYDELVAPDGEILDMEMYFWDWSPGDPDPDVQLRSFTTQEIGDFNEVGSSDPDYDALYEQVSIEPDEEQRLQLVHEASQFIYDNVLVIPLVRYDNIAVHSTDFTGLDMVPNGMYMVWQLSAIAPAA